MGMQNAKASASCVTVPPNGNLVQSTRYVAIKYGIDLFAYAVLGDKFIAFPRHHSCGDCKHATASTKTNSTEEFMEAFVEATSSAVYFLLP